MFNSIYLAAAKGAQFTAEEVAGSLVAITSRQNLLSLAALRIAGFDAVAAGCAALAAVESTPQNLGRVVELFERDQPEVFASLIDEVVAAVGEKAIRSVWASLRNANAIGARDVLLGLNAKLVDLAAKPVPAHKKEKAARRFEDLVQSKRTGGTVPRYPHVDHISH